MAQSGSGCERYQVGTREWTDCVHDQATGGGLMPWIVVIPLAVMVVGMVIGFAYQFSGAGRRRAGQGAAGTAGTWLIFVAFIELSIGVGSVVAAERAPGPGGGYAAASVVLLGVGVLLLVLGIVMKVKGFRRRRIVQAGLPASAKVLEIRQTPIRVNENPVFEFDLEVTGAGTPFRTTHRETIPLLYLGRITQLQAIPVKVDPSRPTKLVFDWERVAQAPVAPVQPAEAQESSAEPMPPSVTASQQPSFIPVATSGSVTRRAPLAVGAVVLLLVLAVLGIGMYFLADLMGTVRNATDGVSEQVEGALDAADDAARGAVPGGSRREVKRKDSTGNEVGYSVAIPLTWSDVIGQIDERQAEVVVDLVVKPIPVETTRSNVVVTRSLRFLEEPAARGASVETVIPGIRRELGGRVSSVRTTRLDGEEARTIDLRPSDGTRARQVVVMREGQLLFVALTSTPAEWKSSLPVFEEMLKSWRWTN